MDKGILFLFRLMSTFWMFIETIGKSKSEKCFPEEEESSFL